MPLFFEKTIHRGASKKYLFFPWRSPLLTYYPLNKCKYWNYSLFCEMGGFWEKGRTPGERWPKCLQWTQLFSKISTGSLALLVKEKIGFQNSKFWKNTLIWPHFCEGTRPFPEPPPSRKITNDSGIYTYWGGNMSREGTAREKINNFSEAPRCIVFSK